MVIATPLPKVNQVLNLDEDSVRVIDNHNDESDETLFEIRHVSGKGKCMFAVTSIAAGEVILREKPLILMPDKIFSLDDMDKIETWLDRQINKLSSEEREIFFDLTDARNPMDKSALGIFFTNDMNYGREESAGLFPIMARVNHNCQPNADFVSRVELGVQDLVAVTAIDKGQEINLSYLPSSDVGSNVKQARMDYLIEWYGFRCTCQTCTLQDGNLIRNEETRKLARKFQTEGNEMKNSDEFLKHLTHLDDISAKLPHRLKVCEEAFNEALKEGNESNAVEILTQASIQADIIADKNQVSLWDQFRTSDWVKIDGQIHLFPSTV